MYSANRSPGKFLLLIPKTKLNCGKNVESLKFKIIAVCECHMQLGDNYFRNAK
jgi:hypothetical protein